MRCKVLLVLAALFAVCYYMSGEEQEISFSRNRSTTRSIVSLPEASIGESGTLTISFESVGVYTLSIESGDNVVFSSFLPADGCEYSFDLSNMEEGTYYIVLEGPTGEYEGYFFID